MSSFDVAVVIVPGPAPGGRRIKVSELEVLDGGMLWYRDASTGQEVWLSAGQWTRVEP